VQQPKKLLTGAKKNFTFGTAKNAKIKHSKRFTCFFLKTFLFKSTQRSIFYSTFKSVSFT